MGKVGICRLAVLGCVLVTGCGVTGPAANRSAERLESSSPHAAHVIERLQGAFQIRPPAQPLHAPTAQEQKPRPLLASGAARGFLRNGDSLRPTFSPAGISASTTVAEVVLPAAATDSFQLRDVASGLSIAVTLRGRPPEPWKSPTGTSSIPPPMSKAPTSCNGRTLRAPRSRLRLLRSQAQSK